MAVRSGAGTGVVVSLVVFILTTFFLLVLTIVFYSKQTKANEAKAAAEKTLAAWIKPAERNNESFKHFEDAAKGEGQSVARYLQEQMQSTMAFTEGTPSTSLMELKTSFARIGVEDNDVIKDKFQDARRALRDREDEIDRLNTQLQSWKDENTQVRAQMAALEDAHKRRLDEVQEQIGEYRDAAVAYRADVDDLKSDTNAKVERLRDQYDRERSRLQDEIDQLSEQRVVLINRIDDLESKIRQDQIAPPDPSVLVDGRIIDSAGRSDQVFIDRGRIHHIVLGMTFEVYDDAASLAQVSRTTGALPRGKASIEVIKVGETTSTCKVVRNVPGRPVVRDDVIANAVYDPTYKFKFLVHGKYDVDGDGRPTEAEAEFVRSLVMDWGGEIVTGDSLPGDLDFLVLGVEPPLPTTLPDDAPPHVVDSWVRKRQAYETFQRLQQQARDAQIPVLNSNRFFILTGYTVR